MRRWCCWTGVRRSHEAAAHGRSAGASRATVGTGAGAYVRSYAGTGAGTHAGTRAGTCAGTHSGTDAGSDASVDASTGAGTPCPVARRAFAAFWLTNLIDGTPLRQGLLHAALSLRVDCPVCGMPNLERRCAHDASFVADVPVERVIELAIAALRQAR